MIFAIPVAWLQLIYQKVRFVATLIGLGFVVILLFLQLGFQDALFSSAVRVHEKLIGDLFVVSTQYQALTAQQSFPSSRLYQSLGFEGVESVHPVYFQFGKLKNPDTHEKFSIFIFGIDPGNPVFDLPEVDANLDRLKLASTALFDRESRPEFGPIASTLEQGKSIELEVTPFNAVREAYRIKISGLFGLGPSFGVDGNLMVNLATFLNMFADRTTEVIDIGSITLKPGVDPEKVRQSLENYLPQDVRVLTRKDFIGMEKRYWNDRTPIGFSFRLMVTMGFVVGIGIAYQILYSNIASHLTEYATLKAIGFTNTYLLNVVFQQAILLAVLSYLPGIAVSAKLFDLSRLSTRLPINLTLDKGAIVLVSITLMCMISGVFAIQKLRAADPADIF